MDPDKLEESYDSVEKYKEKLEDFTYKELSKENRITYDILKLDFSTQLSIKDNYMLQEPLSPIWVSSPSFLYCWQNIPSALLMISRTISLCSPP